MTTTTTSLATAHNSIDRLTVTMFNASNIGSPDATGGAGDDLNNVTYKFIVARVLVGSMSGAKRVLMRKSPQLSQKVSFFFKCLKLSIQSAIAWRGGNRSSIRYI